MKAKKRRYFLRTTMLLFLMVLTTVSAWADGVNYNDADGNPRNTLTDGIVGNDSPTEINSSNKPTSLSAGWYVVTGNVEYTSTVEISGDVHLILADGCNMTVTADYAISGDEANSLTIYGQGGQTEGTLTARGTVYGINVANDTYSTCLTINGGQVTAIGGDYDIRVRGGNNASVTINGGQVIATGDNGIYAEGDSGSSITINGGKVDATRIHAYSDPGTADIILGWTNASDYIKASSYKVESESGSATSVKTADGKPLTAYTPAATELDTDKTFAYIAGGHTFTYAELTAIAGKKLAPNPDGLAYLDWDNTQNKLVSKNTANDNNTDNDFVYVLQGDNKLTILPGGWYVAKGEVSYTGQLQFNDSKHLNGDTHLILADGCNMTVTDEYAIWGFDSSLTIYGQSTGSNIGRLTTTSINSGIDADKGLTINGGVISATATGDGRFAICSIKDVTINDGQVTATSICAPNVTINGGIVSATGNNGIMAEGTYVNGTITLGWTNNTDYIYASSYGFDGNGTISIKAGQTLYDGEGNSYSGTIDKVNNAYAINGKTLRPYRYGAGTCGDTSYNGGADVTWSYDASTKVLTISGTGPMMYYGSAPGSDNKYHSTAPWHNFDGEIEKVVVENGVTYIGSYAFAYCTALTSVSLPASVVALGDYVCYTSTVTRIDIPNTTAAATLGAGGFGYCPTSLQIAVPSTLLGTYQTVTNWSTYADNLVGVLSETTGFGTSFATGNYEYTRTFKCGIASTVCLPFNVTAAQAGAVGKFYSFYGIDKSGANWEVIMKEATNQVTTDLMADRPYLFMPYIFDGMSTGDAKECTFSGTVTSAGNAGYNGWIESGTSNEWAFQGVYYNFTWADGNENIGKVYGFAASPYTAPDEDHDGNPDYTVNPGDFVRAAAGARIAPFRAFLQCNTVSSGAPRRGAAEVLPSRMTVRLVSADGTATAIGTLDTNTGEITFDNDWYDLNGRRLSGKPTQKGVYIFGNKQVVIK